MSANAAVGKSAACVEVAPVVDLDDAEPGIGPAGGTEHDHHRNTQLARPNEHDALRSGVDASAARTVCAFR